MSLQLFLVADHFDAWSDKCQSSLNKPVLFIVNIKLLLQITTWIWPILIVDVAIIHTHHVLFISHYRHFERVYVM